MEISSLAGKNQSVQLTELTARTSEKLEVSYTDPDGRAFHLDLERTTEVQAVTYDAKGTLSGGGNRGETRGLRHSLTDLEHELRDAGEAVKGFRQLLHRMLKAADPTYAGRFAAFEPVDSGEYEVSGQAVAVTETLTLSMDAVDTDYWSVENTAGRLKDFAVSLFAGGDRKAHVEAMRKAMDQGYGEAEQAFGGALPDIARQTIERAREMLADWAAEAEMPEAPAPDPAGVNVVA